jgi:aminoglycoside 3-N-acetyltransferase I
VKIQQLSSNDIELMEAVSTMFGEVFDDTDSYMSRRPSGAYLAKLLGSESFIALAALAGDAVIGGIAAYELAKFEQERSEIYIYDLAVRAEHRRKGVATALIEKLREIAKSRGAWVIYVQADTAVEDEPAIALYTKLGTREEVLHFDIPVQTR